MSSSMSQGADLSISTQPQCASKVALFDAEDASLRMNIDKSFTDTAFSFALPATIIVCTSVEGYSHPWWPDVSFE